MRARWKHWLAGSRQEARTQAEAALAHSCAGRVVATLRLLVILLALGGWITAFLLLKDSLAGGPLNGAALTNLTCVIFFGGLAAAALLGALVGNFLQRHFWSLLTRRSRAGRDRPQ